MFFGIMYPYYNIYLIKYKNHLRHRSENIHDNKVLHIYVCPKLQRKHYLTQLLNTNVIT